MKRLLLLSVIALFSVHASNLFAAPVPVKVISSYFSISGNVEGEDFDSLSPYHLSYTEPSAVPLDNSVTYGSFYNGASASSGADFFSVSASAWGSGCSPGGSANAVADVIFQPLSPIDQLTIYYRGGFSGAASHGWWMGGIYLTDITEGIPIFSQEVDSLNYFQFGAAGSYLIDHSFQTVSIAAIIEPGFSP
jgi:hypothetical protein